MIADTKKAQAVRNLWHTRVASQISQADAVVAAIRSAIVDNNLTGEFEPAELAAMLAVETDLAALAALPGVTAAAEKYQPTHGDHALVITGVND